jgi:hypothetical protein
VTAKITDFVQLHSAKALALSVLWHNVNHKWRWWHLSGTNQAQIPKNYAHMGVLKMNLLLNPASFTSY